MSDNNHDTELYHIDRDEIYEKFIKEIANGKLKTKKRNRRYCKIN